MPRNTIIGLVSGLMLICLTGVFGYMVLEGWSFFDSLYMTVITLTTTGFKEVYPLTFKGKLFTTFLLLLGFGMVAYTLSALMKHIVEVQFSHVLGRRLMDKRIGKLNGHTVICGFGKIGSTIANQLHQNKQDFVVIEKSPHLIEQLKEAGYNFLGGDATDDDILKRSGVDKAKCLVSVVTSDAENVFITLSARAFNKDLHIIARMYDESAKAKLQIAGANKVISPYTLTSVKITQSIINPAVGDFLEIISEDEAIDFQLADIAITEKAKCVDQTLLSSELRKFGIIVVGIRKKDNQLIFAPSPHEKIELGDRLIALGSGQDLSAVLHDQFS